MKEANRVFITGYSALTASGATADATWQSILSGHSGIDEIKQWDLSSWPHRLGGELKTFQPAKMLPDRKLFKVISRQDVMGINAAMQAVEHSQLLEYRKTLASVDEFNDKTGVYVGSPGNKYYQQYDFLPLVAKTNGDMKQFAEQLFGEVHPMWLLRILPNNVLAYTGITYGFKGPNHNVTNHAASGMQALIEAYQAIKQGLAERAVVVAYDVGTEPQALFYYSRLGVISAHHLKPFDADHDGTILAEGAAALVLESEASAKARSAVCFGEVVSGVSATEAAGLFAIENDGAQLQQMLQKTLKHAAISPSDMGFIVAHGNGNKKSDETEAMAIGAVFDNTTPVTAFKWSMGHTLCASGLLDAVLATKALNAQCIPGIANFQRHAPSCQTLNVAQEARDPNPKRPYAMVINRGFAAINASVVIKSCD